MLVAAAVGAGGWFVSTSHAAGPVPAKQKVKLNIRLDGTMDDSGTELVIKPGNPASRFREITYPVRRDGNIQDIPPFDVETLSADRDCSFAIILKEPGRPDKVFRRSLQIVPSASLTTGKPQVLQCYLSSRDVSNKATATATLKSSTPVAAKPATDPVRQR